jgi:hypothetical protein
MDLMSKGDEDEAIIVDEVDSKEDLLEDQIQEDSTTKLQKDEIISFEVKNEKSQNELNGSNDVDFKKNSKNEKRLKSCQEFEDKVRLMIIILIKLLFRFDVLDSLRVLI